LDGKRAVVTGAASGIGRAVAAGLAAAEAKVSGIDLNAPGDAVCPIETADVSDEAAGGAALGRAVANLGGLDILGNAAGTMPEANLASMNMAHVDRLLAVNVRGPIVIARAALPHLGPGSRIVNIASELAYLGRAGFSVYAATKGAILSLTRSWARE